MNNHSPVDAIHIPGEMPAESLQDVLAELGLSEEEAAQKLLEADSREREADRLTKLWGWMFPLNFDVKASFLKHAALAMMVAPGIFQGRSQRWLAAQCEVTRACLNKYSIEIRDVLGIYWRGSKSESARATYSEIQRRDHWRKRNGPAATPGQDVQTPPAEGSEVAYE